MFAIKDDLFYRYSRFRGRTKIMTYDKEKTDETFECQEGCYIKYVNIDDDTITKVYSLRFYVEYHDPVVHDTILWRISEDMYGYRPFSIDNNEVGITTFGSCKESGWHSHGRDNSSKIINLMDCNSYVLEYEYYKRDGRLLDKSDIERETVDKDKFIEAVKKHQISNV
ncbi:MAG: hypothetical protein E7304_03680 [Butyrivibrio sp.]|jgi:hypothetical protein|uniref:Uncharacterized protein n=1 Tax=Butyrivibrio hungatei TaxID=185008 RepID=A0A1D9P339_9FIRM|nr:MULTISPECIES: hypothetical protein [Butyrivibrio]AOZ96913.1 hypothetical protein bhn_I1880 [Butyrivibrio hungatei]MBE5840490.1 hypothetical protein [Butyrivibrio sp.]